MNNYTVLYLDFSLTTTRPPPSTRSPLSCFHPSFPSISFLTQCAIAKEQELENKLASMQSVINAARELASDSMIVSTIPPLLVSCRVTCVLWSCDCQFVHTLFVSIARTLNNPYCDVINTCVCVFCVGQDPVLVLCMCTCVSTDLCRSVHYDACSNILLS